MRVRAILMSFVMISVLVFAVEAQQSAVRDPQAVTVLQELFRAMGGILPKDALATGTVTIVAGSKTDSGTIRILARADVACSPESMYEILFDKERTL